MGTHFGSSSVFTVSLLAAVSLVAVAQRPPLPPGPLQAPIAPAENPITPGKALLGKALFWEEQLSSTRTVACGTCHALSHGGADARSLVIGLWATNPGPDQAVGTADDIIASPGVQRTARTSFQSCSVWMNR